MNVGAKRCPAAPISADLLSRTNGGTSSGTLVRWPMVKAPPMNSSGCPAGSSRLAGMESRADAWAVLKITSGLGSRHDVDPAAHLDQRRLPQICYRRRSVPPVGP